LRILIVFATAFAIFFASMGKEAAFARRDTPTIIRDAELEEILRDISVPLFEAAGLESRSVHTYIVRDNSLNAFVAGGQNVFVNTGLIMEADNVNQLVGVIAHETGHISGGHLARFQEGLKGASATSIISMLLGAAAIATGAGDAGMAILLGGQEAAQRAALAYSRTQEASADQAAMQFLNETGQSGQGLVDFFEHLGDQELLYTTNQDPYVRSHPLTRDRINSLVGQVQESPYAHAPNPKGFDDMFARMKAKLVGYLRPLPSVLVEYPLSDTSDCGRYARAFAYHQDHQLDKALAEIQSLVRDHPKDPFYWETLGFILFENGKIEESIPPLRKAVELAPRQPLIRQQLAQALIATEDMSVNDEAIAHLEEANRYDNDNPFAWRQLSTAYHKAGNDGMAHLAAAEYFALIGRPPEARMQATMALRSLEKGTPSWLKAQDLMVLTGGPVNREGKEDKAPPPDKQPDKQPDGPPDQEP